MIYHGDCLDILKTLPDKSVDLVLTDPPYGHNNNNNRDLISRRESALGKGDNVPERDNIPIQNDGAEANELFKKVLPELYRVLDLGCCCCCCCCGGGGPDPQFARWSMWLNEVFEFKQMVVWDKGPMGMGWHYRRSYETILVAQKPGAACRWFDETSKIENIIRPGYKGIKKIIPQKEDHPTPKPVELMMHFINLHTKPGDTVLDPFCGGGSSAEAALRLGREYIGIEIDKRFVDMAEARLLKVQEELDYKARQGQFTYTQKQL